MINSVILGVLLHGVGATFAATCYTPQKRVRGWSWQSFWIVQAAVCWLILPFIGAYIFVPNLGQVLSNAPRDAMLKSFLFGMLYGVGGTAFGIAIRYIGFSLTYAIAIGISAVIGTLVPVILKGELLEKLNNPGGGWVAVAMLTGVIGIAITGYAGRLKELDLKSSDSPSEFKATLGLIIAFVAGVLSAVYGISIDAGQPIADVANSYEKRDLNGLVIFIFSNPGAFLTTAVYCIWLHMKHKTAGELVKLPAGPEKSFLPANFAFAILTGCLWYGQFFFYTLGHVGLGEDFGFTSWAIHMLMLVLISGIIGVVLREWRGCKRKTISLIACGLVIMSLAVIMMTAGNQIGAKAAAEKAAAPPIEIVE